ncbi:hypothetical protein C8R43DRAFT_947053 [Mycena crocata]|nr:hypothetical protein C8R43DRAFT_966236 [Mycena crocata]KAJ7162522.1 hypothetical protein C8R43DRAFT_947053 [Mycena crocata]
MYKSKPSRIRMAVKSRRRRSKALFSYHASTQRAGEYNRRQKSKFAAAETLRREISIKTSIFVETANLTDGLGYLVSDTLCSTTVYVPRSAVFVRERETQTFRPKPTGSSQALKGLERERGLEERITTKGRMCHVGKALKKLERERGLEERITSKGPPPHRPLRPFVPRMANLAPSIPSVDASPQSVHPSHGQLGALHPIRRRVSPIRPSLAWPTWRPPSFHRLPVRAGHVHQESNVTSRAHGYQSIAI